MLRHLTHVDNVNHVALVAIQTLADGTRRGVAVARFVHDEASQGTAELAVVVADDAQGQGIATHLLRALATRALESGIHTFSMVVLRTNHRVCKTIERMGASRSNCCGSTVTYFLLVDALLQATVQASSSDLSMRSAENRRRSVPPV
jgi:GNAT superfamily N-acetyltransferase